MQVSNKRLWKCAALVAIVLVVGILATVGTANGTTASGETTASVTPTGSVTPTASATPTAPPAPVFYAVPYLKVGYSKATAVKKMTKVRPFKVVYRSVWGKKGTYRKLIVTKWAKEHRRRKANGVYVYPPKTKFIMCIGKGPKPVHWPARAKSASQAKAMIRWIVSHPNKRNRKLHAYWTSKAQLDAFIWLATKESTLGQNSKAYRRGRECVGFMQLDSDKGSYAQRINDPWNIAKACEYIKKRYGSPTAAQAFHRQHHWY